MFKRTVAKIHQGGVEPAQVTEVNGKPALVFNEIPPLVFISYDGAGNTDQTFIDGVESVIHRKISIESEVGEVTTYTLEKYACGVAKEITK